MPGLLAATNQNRAAMKKVVDVESMVQSGCLFDLRTVDGDGTVGEKLPRLALGARQRRLRKKIQKQPQPKKI